MNYYLSKKGVETASLQYINSSMMNFIRLLEVMSKDLQNVMARGNLDTNSNINFVNNFENVTRLEDRGGMTRILRHALNHELYTHTKNILKFEGTIL